MKKLSKRVLRLVAQNSIAKPCELTYKSTTDEGCQKAGLEPYQISLKGRCSWRYLYASARFLSWMTGDMPKITPQFKESDPVKVQLASEFFGFCDGLGLALGSDIRCLRPLTLSVWELKTPDIRLFGWFPEKNYFIVHDGAAKANLEKDSDYQPFVDEVVRFRNTLTGFLPTHITEGKMRHVVSNRPLSF
jgi:hypothetical protein